ncbi:MAG: hypothetical protein K0U98_05305 [Deltaproteobacteria bacterium]|nr:hypothetical protein [Deltaproteobacteria bacterium]
MRAGWRTWDKTGSLKGKFTYGVSERSAVGELRAVEDGRRRVASASLIGTWANCAAGS